MIFLGIDPGLSGAVAALVNDQFLFVDNLPVQAKGNGKGFIKNCIDPVAVSRLISRQLEGYSSSNILCLLESVNAMPGQGTASMFSLGDTFGSLRSIIPLMRIDLILISPKKWKNYFTLSSDKQESIDLALKFYPEASNLIYRKKDADRAEALLIARYAYEVHNV